MRPKTYDHGSHCYDLGSAYGHIAISVSDAYAACAKIKAAVGVEVGAAIDVELGDAVDVPQAASKTTMTTRAHDCRIVAFVSPLTTLPPNGWLLPADCS